jgi:hypothetical protein
MTKRIAEAVAETLYHARLYLVPASKPVDDIDAVIILFHAEVAVRLENSQN